MLESFIEWLVRKLALILAWLLIRMVSIEMSQQLCNKCIQCYVETEPTAKRQERSEWLHGAISNMNQFEKLTFCFELLRKRQIPLANLLK